ncbi:MAG: Gfo/Idh/MocA family oxidoreductase [Lentisphaerae bacterium]|nr:Gfo/Idh/MocA family oxidoreductase [Lentisphaerota bacterium]
MAITRYKKASDIKVGIVGYGPSFGMGRKHLSEMRDAGMTPTSVVDLAPECLAKAREEFPGIETYAALDKMLKKSATDLVVIATPHNSHSKLAVQCLKAGRHVVCEKPFAITTAECDAMITTARKRNLMVSTYHNRHWDGCILEGLKRIRDEKAIGEVYRIEAHMGGHGKPLDWWRSSRSISGGILYDWGAHLLEYSLQLIDSKVVEVTGFAHTGYWGPQTKWKQDTNEDEACAMVRFRNGAWLNLTLSALDSNPKRGIMEITGTKGSYVMDHGTFEVITRDGSRTITDRGGNTKGQGEKFYQNIAAHLTKGERLVITPEWARRPIHIIDLAVRSARQNRALRAKYG